jgi:hypothetical protein
MARSGSHDSATYRCVVHHSGVSCPSPAGIVASRVEGYVEELVLSELGRLEAEGPAKGPDLEQLERELAGAEAEVAAYLAATSAADLGAELFAAGLTPRRERAEAARAALDLARSTAAAGSVLLGGREAWARLDAAGRNEVVRAMFRTVVVGPVGRGRRVPVAERVVAYGRDADLALPTRGTRGAGAGAGIMALPLDPDDPQAIRLEAA